jgi:hypothetical protein
MSNSSSFSTVTCLAIVEAEEDDVHAAQALDIGGLDEDVVRENRGASVNRYRAGTRPCSSEFFADGFVVITAFAPAALGWNSVRYGEQGPLRFLQAIVRMAGLLVPRFARRRGSERRPLLSAASPQYISVRSPLVQDPFLPI